MGRFLSAGRTRQRVFAGFLALIVIVLSLLGTDIWLRSREMNWNVLHIWVLAQVGLYDGPPMKVIPAWTFDMGDSDCTPDAEKASCPKHSVMIQRFEMGRYEVTFDEYSAFVLDRGHSKLPPNSQSWGRGSRPVIDVRWEGAKAYVKWLNEKVARNKTFRLPTEAEWEYACRAGTRTRFYTGDTEKDLDQAGWYDKNSGGQTHPVGEKRPTSWVFTTCTAMSGSGWRTTTTVAMRGPRMTARPGSINPGLRPRDTRRLEPRCSVLPVGRALLPQARLPPRLRGLPPLQVRCPWPLSHWTLGVTNSNAALQPPKRSRRPAGRAPGYAGKKVS